jgi:hypothetical protein
MPNKTRKPAKPAKPSKPVQRVRLTEQATPTKKGRPDKPTPRTFVLYGADEFGKPRAAKFAADDKELLAKAAEALHLRLVEVTTPDMAAIAAKLPTGRLHATGGGLVPHIKDSLYLDLVAENLTDLPSTPRPDPTARDVPGSWDEIAPGHLVVAKESQECGWWEATVVERNGDLVTLRYLDYPHCPAIVRHRSAVALISLGAK